MRVSTDELGSLAARWLGSEPGKQAKNKARIDEINTSETLSNLRAKLIEFKTSDTGPVFPNQDGIVYTPDGFRTMWQRLRAAALAAGAITQSFTFHSLRAYYVTTHKDERGTLPDMHSTPEVTEQVYERSRKGRRKAL